MACLSGLPGKQAGKFPAGPLDPAEVFIMDRFLHVRVA